MRIGVLIPAMIAVSGPGGGVRAQVVRQFAALERLGHEVVRLDAWDLRPTRELDLVHFVQGAAAMQYIEQCREQFCRRLVFSPIIDSNEPNWRYRLAAAVGRLHPKFFTIPRLYRDQALGSDLVVARSTHERDRLVRGLGIDAGKVRIVLNGVDPVETADPAAARRTLGLPAEYALHVSKYGAERKNIVRLVEAVGPTGVPLLLAGDATPGAGLERVKAAAARFSSVRLLPFLDRPTLDGLLAGARVFCLPSFHEGTGLAALEAAAAGANVVVTKHGGPPDYFGTLAEYVDPFRTEDIRAGFLRAWERPRDGALKRHVLGNLTWDHSARNLARAYEELVGGGAATPAGGGPAAARGAGANGAVTRGEGAVGTSQEA